MLLPIIIVLLNDIVLGRLCHWGGDNVTVGAAVLVDQPRQVRGHRLLPAEHGNQLGQLIAIGGDYPQRLLVLVLLVDADVALGVQCPPVDIAHLVPAQGHGSEFAGGQQIDGRFEFGIVVELCLQEILQDAQPNGELYQFVGETLQLPCVIGRVRVAELGEGTFPSLNVYGELELTQ